MRGADNVSCTSTPSLGAASEPLLEDGRMGENLATGHQGEKGLHPPRMVGVAVADDQRRDPPQLHAQNGSVV